MNSNKEKKLKIAYLSDSIYPYHKGGKEKRLFDVSTRMAQRGHTVTIYCMKWWDGNDEIKENGVKLHAISPLHPLYINEKRSIKQGILFGIYSMRLFWFDFDVLDADHMPYFPLFSARIVCWIKKKKLVGTWNEVWGLAYWKKYLGIKGYILLFLDSLRGVLRDT